MYFAIQDSAVALRERAPTLPSWPGLNEHFFKTSHSHTVASDAESLALLQPPPGIGVGRNGFPGSPRSPEMSLSFSSITAQAAPVTPTSGATTGRTLHALPAIESVL